MRILVTGDWQTEWANIPQCKKVAKTLLKLIEQHKLEAIVFAGDQKQNYNPVDVRVVKFWHWLIHTLKKSGVRVLILLGNHDRLGMYNDAENWLSVLRKAGAEVFDTPSFVQMSSGRVAMLPYSSSASLLRKRAGRLAKEATENDVLIFHNDVKGCNYNILGERSQSRTKSGDLHPSRYLACIGAHIHLPQKIGKNIYYVGSPFAMDWGEANQNKRFLVVIDGTVRSIPSEMPGWYDPSWPNFVPPANGNYDNAHVRVHVRCDSKKSFRRYLDDAQRRAVAQYPNAVITAIPEFVSTSRGTSKDADTYATTDSSRIRAYVKDTLTEALHGEDEKVVGYLIHQLNKVEKVHRFNNSKLYLSEFVGKNVLSFKDIQINFRHQGLVVVEGKNKDWSGQSNGSGKSNYVNTIPVSLFGKTFKGQKADRWARRYVNDKATAILTMHDDAKNEIKVVRGRRPTKVKLLINGVDQSSGMNKSTRDGTQLLIERKTGFTWETFANSVYIDREVTESFLTGTKGKRTELLSRFQNLERFTKALALVKKSRENLTTAQQQVISAIDILKTKVEDAHDALRKAKKESSKRIDDIKTDYNKRLKEWKKFHAIEKKAELDYRAINRRLSPEYDRLSTVVVMKDKGVTNLQSKLLVIENELQKIVRFMEQGTCPTCGKEVDKSHYKDKIASLRRDQFVKERILKAYKEASAKINRTMLTIEGKIDEAKIAWSEAKSTCKTLKIGLLTLREQMEKHRNRDVEAIKACKRNIVKLEKELDSQREYKKSLKKEWAFMDYCQEAFSRDGIPAFINAQLCPILNKASAYYSDIFTNNEINVVFEMVDGELEPKILNAHGGDDWEDQSMGERAMASVIASFALKEIAPKTNVLILDEPGMGMSEQNLKQFAKGLLKVKDKFETIYVVTHLPMLVSALSGEKHVKILKKNRISRVIHG